jgi:uncharacterized protein (DUF58 family)
VTRRPTPRLLAYATAAAAGLIGSLVTGRPELAAVATPLIVLLVIGLALAGDPEVTAKVVIDRDRVIEGDDIRVDVTIGAERTVSRLVVGVDLPAGVVATDPPVARVATTLDARVTQTLTFRLTCRRWGAHRLGEIRVRARDPLALFGYEALLGEPHVVRVFPSVQRLRNLALPVETRARSGSRVSRVRGEGIELADLRPFVPGDRARSVNWRATARRGAPWVTERHPEREVDIVLLLDAFADVGGDVRTLDLAIRAASALTSAYLRDRDRVGLVAFGGYLRWVEPGSGERHAYRVAEALLDTAVAESFAWKTVDVVPARTLPPKALVITLSPLIDARMVGAITDLRRRGHDVAVIELDATALVEADDSRTAQLAHRIWRLQHRGLRRQLEALGVAVGVWDGTEPLPAIVEGVRVSRRRLPAGRV